MARVANSKRIIVRNALAYIEDKIHAANNKLLEEEDSSGKYSSGYLSGLDAGAKTDVKNATKMFRWLIQTYLGLSVPAAYTNTQVGALDPDIRTHEE